MDYNARHRIDGLGYAPLQTYTTPNILGGLHPWVRLVIWLLLILVWVVASLLLFRSASTHRDGPTG